MKLHKILKSIKKESKITFWLSLLPITLLVGILWQIAILSKYNAIVFFSWWQVLNDTAIVMLLIISYIWWYFSYNFFKTFKPNLPEKWRGFLFIIYSFFLITIIFYFLWIFNIYLIWIFIFYIFWYFQSILDWTIKNNENVNFNLKYWIFIISSIPLYIIYLLFILILCFSILVYNFIYQNIEIKIEKINYKINYMNDKYIIYSSWSETKIIPNDWKNDFIINDTLKN